MSLHTLGLSVHVEQHGRIASQGSLVEADVERGRIGCLEQHRGLDSGAAGALGLGVTAVVVQRIGQTAESGFGEQVFIRVVVAGDAVQGVVAGEIELGVLATHGQIVVARLHGELIAESQAVIEQAEAHSHSATGLLGGLCRVLTGSNGIFGQVHGQFLEVVAHGGVFAPHRFPAAVHGHGVDTGDGETTGVVGFVRCQAQKAGGNHLRALIVEAIERPPLSVDVHIERQLARRRRNAHGCRAEGCREH